MKFLLFNIEGRKPSGVATFCMRMAESSSDFFVVSLDVDEGGELLANEISVPVEDSHSPEMIVERVVAFFADSGFGGEGWVLVPNVGVACYEASCILADRIRELDSARAGILAVCHSDDENQFRMISHYQDQLDAVMFVSQLIGARLRRELPSFSEEQLSYLRIPLPENLLRKPAGSLSDPPTLVYLGRLDRVQKRIDRLGDLLAQLLCKGIKFRFVAIGDGRDRGVLEKALAEIGRCHAWDNFSFLGALPQGAMFERLAEADIALLTSEYEGTPLAVLEALAVGLCSVVMDFESLQGSELRDRLVIVEQGDVDAMALMICDLLSDREKLRRISEEGAVFVRSRYTVAFALAELTKIGTVAVERGSNAKAGSQSAATRFDEASLEELVSKVQDCHVEGDRTAVVGVGMFGREFIDRLSRVGIEPVGLADSDSRKWGRSYNGLPIGSYNELLDIDLDAIVLASNCFAAEMESALCASYRKVGRPMPKLVSIQKSDPEEST